MPIKYQWLGEIVSLAIIELLLSINLFECTACKAWIIHKRCSSVCGALTKVTKIMNVIDAKVPMMMK